VQREIFAIEKPYATLTFPHEGGITGYFSRDMTSKDLSLVREFLKSEKIDALNTRAFKREYGFEITVGSIEVKSVDFNFSDKLFKVNYGEFAPYLDDMNYNLK